MKLFGSTKKLINKTKNGEKVPSLEVVEVVLVQCNLVDNQYQQKSEVLYTFMPNKSYAYLLNAEPSNLAFLKTYNQARTVEGSLGANEPPPPILRRSAPLQ